MGITWLGAELSVDVAIVVIELDCVLFDFWDQRWLKCTHLFISTSDDELSNERESNMLADWCSHHFVFA